MDRTQDLNDDELPGDELPPEAEFVPPDRRPLGDIPPDEGNAEAERKEDADVQR